MTQTIARILSAVALLVVVGNAPGAVSQLRHVNDIRIAQAAFPDGTRVTIVDIGEADAFYGDRDDLVGRTGKVEGITNEGGGWYGGAVYLDGADPDDAMRFFLSVKLKPAAETASPDASVMPSAARSFSKQEIRDVQETLNVKGYDAGPVDGTTDAKTSAAIRAYQADWGLEQTGEVSRKLIDMLERETPETKPQWFNVENMDCQVWNGAPAGKETATWSGDCVDGKISGNGKLVWQYTHKGKRLEASYEGEYRDGKLNGQGVYVWADGARYEGEWRDGAFHGRGTRTYSDGGRYEGEWRDGKRSGQGVLNLPNGDRYEGTFRDGTFHGRGTRTYSDGGRYEGEWRDGERTGQGIFVWANGDRYEGAFRDGVEVGFGVQVWANGNRYEGEWRDQMHGQGAFVWADGARYEGEFRDGERNGQGIFVEANGNRYEGEFRDGKRNGRGIYVWADGDRYEGEFRDGAMLNAPVFQMTNDQVHRVQKILYELNWDVGTPDGRLGPRTRNGISGYQEKRDWPVTGHLTREQYEYIVGLDVDSLTGGWLWGTISASVDGAYGSSWRYRSRAEAEDRALKTCRSKSRHPEKCTTVSTYDQGENDAGWIAAVRCETRERDHISVSARRDQSEAVNTAYQQASRDYGYPRSSCYLLTTAAADGSHQ